MGLTKNGFDLAYQLLTNEFGEQFPDAQLKIHQQMLIEDNIEDEQLINGVKFIIRTRKYNKLPKYAEILEACRGGNIDDIALLACNMVKKAAERAGAYKSVVFPDLRVHFVIDALGGWIKLCRSTEEEWIWLQKEFIAMYKAVMNKPINPPEVLIGIEDKENLSSGYIDEPKAIVRLSNDAFESVVKTLPAIPKPNTSLIGQLADIKRIAQ